MAAKDQMDQDVRVLDQPCTGAPDLCGAPAGVACGPGCASLAADPDREQDLAPAQLAVHQPEAESWRLMSPAELGQLLAEEHYSGLSLVGEVYLLPSSGGAPQCLTLQLAATASDNDYLDSTYVLVNGAGEEHAEHVYVTIDGRA